MLSWKVGLLASSLAISLACQLSTACGQTGGDLLTPEMCNAARIIKERQSVVAPNDKQILVGEFKSVGNAVAPSTGAAAIERALGEQLEAAGFKLAKDARWVVKGKFGGIREENTDNNDVGVSIDITLTDRNGATPDWSFNRGLISDFNASSLLGATFIFRPGQDRVAQVAALEQGIEKPLYSIRNGIVFADDASGDGVELLVKQGNQFLPVRANIVAGAATANVGINQVYAIRIHNLSGNPSAVRVFVDGLDMYSFADKPGGRDEHGRPKYSHLVVAGNQVDILGWYFDDASVKEFLVQQYSPNAPPHMRPPGKVGMITVQFHRAWPTNADLPAGETGSQVAAYTALGARVKQATKPADYRVGQLRGAVTIRYSK